MYIHGLAPFFTWTVILAHMYNVLLQVEVIESQHHRIITGDLSKCTQLYSILRLCVRVRIYVRDQCKTAGPF